MGYRETKKKFEEYKKATGGKDPIGLMVPFGYPPGVEEMGGPEAVYDECIKQGRTWEDLLEWNPPKDARI